MAKRFPAIVLLASLSIGPTLSAPALEPLQQDIGVVAANPITVSLTPLLRGVKFEVVNHTSLTVTAWYVKVDGSLPGQPQHRARTLCTTMGDPGIWPGAVNGVT